MFRPKLPLQGARVPRVGRRTKIPHATVEQPKKIKIGGGCYQEKEKMLIRQNHVTVHFKGLVGGDTVQEMSKVKVKEFPAPS